jgi:cupin 2 domain-containing protein
MANVFEGVPRRLPEEFIETLLDAAAVRVERIVSHGHRSPEGFWYDQETDEWVVVLRGHAVLRFADAREVTEMRAGDYMHIAARRRHRVEWTTPDEPTVWLAVHYTSGAP